MDQNEKLFFDEANLLTTTGKLNFSTSTKEDDIEMFFEQNKSFLSFPFFIRNISFDFFNDVKVKSDVSIKFWKKANIVKFFTQIIHNTNLLLKYCLLDEQNIEVKKNDLDIFNTENINHFCCTVPFVSDREVLKNINGIKINFNINYKTHQITGEVQWNVDFSHEHNYWSGMQNLYVLNLIKSFFSLYLFPCTLDRFTQSHTSVSEQKIQNLLKSKKVSYEVLKTQFADLIFSKIPEFATDTNALFDELWFLFTMQTTVVHLLQHLFVKTHLFSQLDYQKINELVIANNVITIQQLQENIAQNVQILLEHDASEHNQERRLIKKQPIGLESVALNYNMLAPNMVYYFDFETIKAGIRYNQMFENPYILSVLLMTLYPEVYSLDNKDFTIFSSWQDVILTNKMLFHMKLNKFIQIVKDTMCERTILYYSFVRNNNSILLINNPLLAFKENDLQHVVDYYATADVLVSANLNQLANLKRAADFVQFSYNVRWKQIPYHKILREMQGLEIDYTTGTFFKNNQMRAILKKMDQDADFTTHLHNQSEEVFWNDELFKRGIERNNFIIGFIVAILVGFINYFGQLYSETTDSSNVGVGFPGIDLTYPWIPMTLGFASVAEFAMICILIFAFYRFVYIRFRMKQIDLYKIRLM